jgi:shikimate dehydrogenase
MSAPIKAAVIGHPIKHSKSPLIHNYWIEKYGLAGSYEAIDLSPENLESGLKRLIDEGYTGFNFTVPHKQSMLKICDELDNSAKVVGAVNTALVRGGKIHGSNTDSFGFLANITQSEPNFEFDLGPAVVLGAGGAARAVISGLIGMRAPQIILINRTKEKAEALAQDMGFGTDDMIRVVDWEGRAEALDHANLLVNTTSLGMEGQPPLGIDLSQLPSFALVNDIVYAPLYTDLLTAAKGRGNPVVTGIGMLLHQARPAFKEWFGLMPDIDEDLQELVLK